MAQANIIYKIVNGEKMYYCEQLKEYLPAIEVDQAMGMKYQLDLETWTYNPIVRVTTDPTEAELLKQPIGIYGQRWQEFMEKNYPQRLLELQLNLRWAIIPRLIDKEAEEMLITLEKNYTKTYPIPTDFWEKATYYKTMQQHNSSIIMREIVLQPRE